MKKQGGFTIIELVLVIVILGILAAYAVPKFIGMDREARVAVMKGVRGSLESAVTMVQGKAIMSGKTLDETDVITVDGVDIALAYGYPAAKGNGDGQGVTAVLSRFDENDFIKDEATVGTVKIALKSAADTTGCYVQYTQPTAAGNAPTTDVVTTGC